MRFEASRRQFMTTVTTACAVAAGGAILPARAAAPLASNQFVPWYRTKVGDFQLTVVSDGVIDLGDPTNWFLGKSVEGLTEALTSNFLDAKKAVLEENVLVINTGDKLVLVDTGFGKGEDAARLMPTGGRLIANLASAGFKPEDFDVVIISHTHPDHCWGLLDMSGKAVFPNAQIFVPEEDFVYWTDEARASDPDPWGLFVRVTRKQLLPLRERIAFFKDGDEILPGITAIAAHGHSVGHSVLMISSGNESILYAADIAHHLVLLYNPAMTFAHDTDQQQAARSRTKILDMVATDRIRTMSYHFPFPGIGFVSRRGDGFIYHPEPIRTVL